MSAVNVPPGDTFSVINADTVSYNGTNYTGVSDIEYPDGTHKTPQQVIDEAGGTSLGASQLKGCIKVQGINPDENNREIFSLYSNNSHQTVKNTSAAVPGGGMSVEMFNFLDDYTTNYIVKMWADFFYPGVTPPGPLPFDPTWLGFRINYGITETRAYTMTQVNSFEEESVPCPPALIDVTYMHGVKAAGVFKQPAPILGNFFVPIVEFRLYRSQTTSDGSFVFRLVLLLPQSPDIVGFFPKDTSFGVNFWVPSYRFFFDDGIRNEDLSTTVIPSEEWDAPPPDLKGLQALPNGSLAAFKGNNVYFSEPFRPHAWPEIYIQTVGFEITALEQDGAGLIALTTGFAYALLGAHPSVVIPQRLDQTQAAKRAGISNVTGVTNPSHSVCKTPVGLVYACDEGLMREFGGQTQMLTGQLMTKKEWQERFNNNFTSLWLAYSNGKIFGYQTGGPGAAFLCAIDGSWMTEYVCDDEGFPNEIILTHFTLPGSDGLYVVTGKGQFGDVSNLRRFEQWDGGTMAATWVSKQFVMAKPYCFACYQIVGSGTVTVHINAGGRDILVEEIAFDEPYEAVNRRIPYCEREREWQVTLILDAGAVVSEFYMAGSFLELQSA